MPVMRGLPKTFFGLDIETGHKRDTPAKEAKEAATAVPLEIALLKVVEGKVVDRLVVQHRQTPGETALPAWSEGDHKGKLISPHLKNLVDGQGGMGTAELTSALKKFLASAPGAPIVGANAKGFDVPLLEKFVGPLTNAVIDVLDVARRNIPLDSRHTLANVSKALNIKEEGGEHHAEAGAANAVKVAEELANRDLIVHSHPAPPPAETSVGLTQISSPIHPAQAAAALARQAAGPLQPQVEGAAAQLNRDLQAEVSHPAVQAAARLTRVIKPVQADLSDVPKATNDHNSIGGHPLTESPIPWLPSRIRLTPATLNRTKTLQRLATRSIMPDEGVNDVNKAKRIEHLERHRERARTKAAHLAQLQMGPPLPGRLIHANSYPHQRQLNQSQFINAFGPLKGIGKTLVGLDNSSRGMAVSAWKFFRKKDEEGKTGADRFAQRTAPGLFVGSTALAGEAVRSASPAAFDLVTGSFQLLAAQIGTALIPEAVALAIKLQQVAQFVEQMSPGLKSWLATLAGGGIAILGFATVLGKVQQLFAVFGAKLSLSGGLAITAVGALAGAIMVAFETVNQKAQEIQALKDAANKPVTKEEEVESADELFKQAMSEEDPGKRQKKLDILANNTKKDLADAQSDTADLAKTNASTSGKATNVLDAIPMGIGSLFRVLDSSTMTWGKKSATIDARMGGHTPQEAEDESRKKERTYTARLKLIEEAKAGQVTPEMAAQMKVHDKSNTAVGIKGILAQLGTTQQPQFSSIDDAYKKTQLDVLGKSPLEEKLDQMHREGLLKMLDELAKQSGLAQQLVDEARKDPRFAR